MYRFSAVMMAWIVGTSTSTADIPIDLSRYFRPPEAFRNDFGHYRSPLLFDDGRMVKTAADWQKRREEIHNYWHTMLGLWPAPLERPRLERGPVEQRGRVKQYPIRIETAPKRIVEDAYLLIPEGEGPFPAVIVVYYEAKTAVGLGQGEFRDFAWQLAQRGFVTLSLGGDPNTYYPTRETCQIQPLSFHAYEASNCRRALAQLDNVDPKRIGIVGHSYGSKWAMFASCLDDGFACAAWSDGGIVFDESRPNVNYWEPWYLGFERGQPPRQRGVPTESNPRTGPYAKLIAEKRDLHELHALMAPRPFLVSGGSEDPPERWKALNHTVAVNQLLGYENRVGMTNHKEHSPNVESNEQIYQFFVQTLQPKR